MSDKKEVPKTNGAVFGICGCGRPVRYISSDGPGSCNKGPRCPDYEDIIIRLQVANKLIYAYQARDQSKKKHSQAITKLEYDYMTVNQPKIKEENNDKKTKKD